MAQVERERNAEELEREANSPREASATDQTEPVMELLQRESESLQRGNTYDTRFGPLPLRSLAAMGVMVAIAVAVYLLLWALLGTVGLLFGWIPAAALGLLAARELGRRAEA